MRVARFEIQSFVGDRKEITARWLAASDRLREAHNFVWRTWLVWHTQNGSPKKLRAWLGKLKEWHEIRKDREKEIARRKKELVSEPVHVLNRKPPIPVQAIPKPLDKIIYNGLVENFAELHGRPLELLRQAMERDILSHKSANGDLSGWIAALLDRQAIPSMTHPAPIRFDQANSDLIVPEELGADGKLQPCRLKVRFCRIENGGSKSWLDDVALNSTSRKTSGQRAILRAIMAGDYKFCGSMIQFNKQQGKWFALICWNRIKEEQVGEFNGTAVVSARRRSALMLRLQSGKKIRISLADTNYHPVAAVRRNLVTQRWSRQACYRVAGSANKGHGRDRALEPIWKLSRRWKDFVKSFNHTLTSRIVAILSSHRVVRLVYMQPLGQYRDSRFLSTAGKVQDREDSTGWDWAQIATMFGYKCKELGIHLEVRKAGEQRVKPARISKRKPSVLATEVLESSAERGCDSAGVVPK